MDPVFDAENHVIKIIPSKETDLEVGDIVSFKSNRVNGNIIHRIIEKRFDENGLYFVTKGDNNNNVDSEKVRFEQITGVVVGILY